jgi:type II secretory pathway pseudopilin PulG
MTASRSSSAHAGFALVELMLAAVLLALATTIIAMTLANITRAWQAGTEAAARLNHADAILDQLAAGLRSAYYARSGNRPSATYGFWLEDDGDGPEARDRISWVKSGPALLDPDSSLVPALHRIAFTIVDDEDGRPRAAIRAWRPFAMSDDFDPEEIPWTILAGGIVGFDCAVSTNTAFGEWEWEQTWEETNRLPWRLRLTLYLKPTDPGEKPFAVQRLVEIPCAPLAW